MVNQNGSPSKGKFVVIGLGVAAAVAVALYFAVQKQNNEPVQTAEEMPAVGVEGGATASTGIQGGTDTANQPQRQPEVQPTAAVYPEEQLKLNEQTFSRVVNNLFLQKAEQKPSKEVLGEFAAMGFKLQANVRSNPYTGKRTVNEQREPHDGMFDVNVQYVSGEDGKETLEGIRMSFSSVNGGYEKQMEKIRGELPPEWKESHKSEDGTTWVSPEGYILWLKRYDAENPPPAGGNVDIVRMGYEPSLD
jgi:hypothetical protein